MYLHVAEIVTKINFTQLFLFVYLPFLCTLKNQRLITNFIFFYLIRIELVVKNEKQKMEQFQNPIEKSLREDETYH